MRRPQGRDITTVSVRNRRLRDMQALVRTTREGFPGWQTRLPYLLLPTLVAEFDGRLCGFVSLHIRAREGEVALIAVADSFRRLGIGRTLLEGGEAMLRCRGVGVFSARVRLDNLAGRKMFEAFGFRSVALKRRRILGDVEEMAKIIVESQLR